MVMDAFQDDVARAGGFDAPAPRSGRRISPRPRQVNAQTMQPAAPDPEPEQDDLEATPQMVRRRLRRRQRTIPGGAMRRRDRELHPEPLPMPSLKVDPPEHVQEIIRQREQASRPETVPDPETLRRSSIARDDVDRAANSFRRRGRSRL